MKKFSNEFKRENKRHYQEVEDYDWVEVVDSFLGLEAILHRLREKETLELVKDYGGKGKFLDAGCGTGLILRHLPEGSVGLDINPRNIKRAKRHAKKVKLVLGDIEKLPFEVGEFETVICTEVLEHLPEPQRALAEIWRVLEGGGRLIGSVPAKNPIWALRFLSSTHPGEPYHHLYKRKEIKDLMGSWGEVLELKRGAWGMSWFFVVGKGGG